MPLNHRAEHGKLTPGHISMVIEPDGLLPGKQRAGGSASLCPHQRGWHGETTGAHCVCSMAARIDRLTTREPTGPVRGIVARGVAPVISRCRWEKS